MADSTLTADALVTWEYTKEMLSLEDEDQAYTEGLINAASAYANTHTGRLLKARENTEFLDGLGSCDILAKQRPIMTISELNIDSSRTFTAATKETEYVFDAETGLIVLSRRIFPKGRLVVKLVYTAGYGGGESGVVPNDLQQAVLEIVSQNFTRLRSKGIGVRQASGPDGLSTTFEGAIPFNALKILDSYRDPRCA